jgi:hypothetical protein
MYYDYFRLLYGDMLNGMFYIEELVCGFFWPSKHRFFSVSPPPLRGGGIKKDLGPSSFLHDAFLLCSLSHKPHT